MAQLTLHPWLPASSTALTFTATVHTLMAPGSTSLTEALAADTVVVSAEGRAGGLRWEHSHTYGDACTQHHLHAYYLLRPACCEGDPSILPIPSFAPPPASPPSTENNQHLCPSAPPPNAPCGYCLDEVAPGRGDGEVRDDL